MRSKEALTVYRGACPTCGANVYWNGAENYGPYVCSACKEKK